MTIVKRERGEQVATLPNYPSANNLKTDERKERTQKAIPWTDHVAKQCGCSRHFDLVAILVNSSEATNKHHPWSFQ